ncbi:HtaA domain-containing protein [Streptomyces wuyuanensis]|uniref:HtaA domain-containing protein n=1 Tax=Streptomyces wuyuanensis TaxID=1196353 RepID=UPI0037106CB2
MLPSRPVRTLAVALLAALLGVLLPASGAHAEDRTVRGGRLDWGIKSSFQGYVTGPIAKGRWNLTGGAATTGGSRFRFHSARGSYDPATGAFEASFSGGVHFLGHRRPDGTHELDLAVSRPAVRVAGGRGTLYADLTSTARGTGRVTTSARVPFAALDLSGIDMRGGTSPVALSNVPATLTSQGARAFAGYYTAGTALDPVSLSVDVLAPAAAKPDRQPARSSAPATGTARPSAGTIRDAAVDWGVRRTFREYVTGPVANGRWTLTGGARDGGALFRFSRGKGTYDPKKQTLDARFAGAVRFTGARLDLTLGGFAVTVKGGGGTLLADVTGGGRTEKAVPLVTFPVKDLAPKAGLAAVTEAPATLTAKGAGALGGMYRAGTAMDPVSLAVAVSAGARLPALPDLGSAPSPTATASAAPEPRAAEAAANGGTSVAVRAVAAGVLIAAVAAAALYAARRRRATPGAATGGGATATAAAGDGTSPGEATDSREATDSPDSTGSPEPTNSTDSLDSTDSTDSPESAGSPEATDSPDPGDPDDPAGPRGTRGTTTR